MLRVWTMILAIMLLLTGCFDNTQTPAAGNVETIKPVAVETPVLPVDQVEPVEPEVMEQPELPEERQEIVIKSMLSGPATGKLSVLDLKHKYNADSTQVIMPLYNVKPDEEFTFSFKANMEGIPATDIISVHTDSKALSRSQIEADVDFKSSGSSDMVVKPWIATLASSDTKGGFGTIWGNAPVYYIRINYDVESAAPTKLAKPVIIPFTIKSEVPTPNLSYEIDETGNLKLIWEPVKGASSYRLYYDLSEDLSRKTTGAEEGYKDVFPVLEANVKETEYVISSADQSENSEVEFQNSIIPGEYYLTAVMGDQESNFGSPVSIAAIAGELPTGLGYQNDDYGKLKELPNQVEVFFLDNSVAYRDVIYDIDTAKIMKDKEIPYHVKGTALKGYFNLDDVNIMDFYSFKNAHVKKSSSGLSEPLNSGTSIPTPNVPTIIASGKETGTKEAVLDLISQQRANTKEQVEAGDEQLVPEPDVLMNIGFNANSAFEEFLARNLIDGQEIIPLLAFPEVQTDAAIKDYMQKVLYQNPLILGLNEYYYDYNHVELHIKYQDSKKVMKRKQKEISAEARSIYKSIIKKDMSTQEKSRAIYDYLNDNTVYDEAAWEASQATKGELDSKTQDAFTTYGIMIKKTGVCMSYAFAYKMLADLAGIESVVVTGKMQGGPHAWIKEKIGSEWLHIDPTNGWTNAGIPYLLYNGNDASAAGLDYVMNEKFWLDKELNSFEGKTDDYNYYVKNGLEIHSGAEFKNTLAKLLHKGETVISVRIKYEATGDELMGLASEVLTSAGLSIDDAIAYKAENYFIVWLD